ncbi:MAG: hypothetical protein JWO72_1846, partial [Caulobacteraceae bacterium]|nr:hypothetical protein [Caulobacteraceae bacterium]
QHAADDDVMEVRDQEQAVVQLEVGRGTASSTPVMPPMTKVTMKPTVHSIGVSKRTRPRYMVKSQLKILAPVGIEMTIVVIPKNEFTLAPEPMVKKWCSQTRYDRMVMTTVA